MNIIASRGECNAQSTVTEAFGGFTSLTYILGTILTMPEDSPPDERQRTSSFLADENSVIVRSTIWYDDGSVVLQAECTQFRVHRTLLCQNSTIFTDMFSIPRPSTDESLVEGCSLVHLSDSAEEVETVLRALYFQTYVCSLFLLYLCALSLSKGGRPTPYFHSGDLPSAGQKIRHSLFNGQSRS